MSDEKTGVSKSPKVSRSKDVSGGKKRPKRASDIGRALRSVYDETLREEVPDDFEDLLRKLS